jgi:hypothetical protein
MKPETKPILEGIAAAMRRDFDLAFNAVDPEANGFTPAELFAKKYELLKVGEKATISASISIVRTGNFAKPQHKVKVAVTLKAATPDDDYQELFEFAEEEAKGD